VATVAGLLDDPAPEVRGAAVWALRRLDAGRWEAERGARFNLESDDTVRNEWLLPDVIPAEVPGSTLRLATSLKPLAQPARTGRPRHKAGVTKGN